MNSENRSRKLIIYEEKKTGSYFLRPTARKDGRFSIKPHAGNVGKALGKNVTDAELGKAIRLQFRNCD